MDMDSLKGNSDSPLTKFYDDLKSNLNPPPSSTSPTMINVGGKPLPGAMTHPGAVTFRSMAGHECEKLKDKCARDIIIDIYLHILPLDKSYVDGHRGQMSADVDNMLAAKGMTPTQYLTSCSEKTKAPLLEFVNRAINNIGKSFMEKANDTLKDAQEADVDVPAPQAPDPEEDEEVASQLVDVKKDGEYENFIDKLKEKTIKKIISDVSKIITDKKEEQDMTFDPQPGAGAVAESTVSIALDYLQERLITEHVTVGADVQEQMIGSAIREAVLNELNTCFEQPGTDLRQFKSRINFGKGYVVNESAATVFVEAGNQQPNET